MTLYKLLEDGSWLKADLEVFLPDGRIVSQENQIEGWVWHDNPPQEYIDWDLLEKEKLELKGE